MLKRTFFYLFVSCLFVGAFAQEFQVPENVVLIKKEDYAPYEDDFVQGVDWLLATPANEQHEKRGSVSAFLLQWLSGSPNVEVSVDMKVLTFMESSPDLLMVYLGSWGKYALETKDYNNQLKGTQAGLEGLITYYQKNRDVLDKDKNIEKYIKLQSKGKLESHLKEILP